MVAIVSGLYDCIGPACGEYIPLSGLGELAIGLVVTAIFLAPEILFTDSCEAAGADRPRLLRGLAC